MPGLRVHAYEGDALGGYSGWQASSHWGIHSKRAVIDRQIVMLGTYNIDPRSANLNSELMLVCYDAPDLAAEVVSSINARIAQSQVVVDGNQSHHDNLIGEADGGAVFSMFAVMPVANLFNFLL